MSHSSKTTVLVTGAAGFIGKAVVHHLLDRGFAVTALLHRSRPSDLLELEAAGELNVVTASIIDFDALRHATDGHEFGAVVHCAGRASDVGRDREFKRTILHGTENVVRLVHERGISKLIQLSTTDVYGIKDFTNADEETPLDVTARNGYPKYKILAEHAVRDGLDASHFVILRPAAVWGPGDKTLTPRIVKFLKSSPWIIHFGQWRGRNRWPAVHVDTVVKAVHHVLTDDVALGNAYNVVDPEHLSIDDFYRRLLEEHLPEKGGMRSVTLPFWVGATLGAISTAVSNLFNCHSPLFDPTYYGLCSVSRNLDFCNDKLGRLFESGQSTESEPIKQSEEEL